MKTKFLAVILICLSTIQTSAWISKDEIAKSYAFKFNLQGDVYEYNQKAATYEEAFEQAAQACFSHFKAGKKVGEQRGMDIIDVCANPPNHLNGLHSKASSFKILL